MHPGEMLFRSMFYGTPQASRVSILLAQLVERREALISRETGEGTSSTVVTSDGGYNAALIASNERTIQALLDSLDPPELAEVVQEGVTTTIHGQVSGAPEQSTEDSDVGGMLAPDSAIRESLLHNKESEGFAAIQERVSVGCEDITAPIAANEGLVRALMGSIEAPAVVAPTVKEKLRKKKEKAAAKILKKGEEKKERLRRKEEEEAAKILKKGKGKKERGRKKDGEAASKILEKGKEKWMRERERQRKKEEEAATKTLKKEGERLMREQERLRKEQEKLRKKEEEIAVKRREREIETALSVAVCRETDLEKIKDKVKNLEVTGTLGSRRKRDIEMVEVRERELRKVLAEPRPEDMQEMKKELEKVRARCKELKQAGAGEAAADVDRVRTKETRVRVGLERAEARGMKMKSLEEELEVLVSRKLYLEKMGSNEEELNKVRTREMEMRVDLTRLRVMSVDERNLELELDKLVAKQKEIEATVDVRRREIELSRLREEAKAGSSDRELELTLRLEYVKARVRALELELGLWLGKIEEKRTGTGGRMTSLVLGESEIARVEKEVGSMAMSGVVSEVIVVQDEAGSLGLEEALVVEEEGAVTVSEASSSGGNDERGGEDWQVPGSSAPEQSTGGSVLAPD
ncbi:hypothetical protein, partial [Candidatus Ichthyocystis sparus]|uniref:hypothetical protein n=1 Tax=Candidatus Ichthyocystis sparus TaxID=1561004 RepID=UPI00159ECF7E